MEFGPYIVIGILAAVIFLILAALILPRIKKYRIVLKKLEPHKPKPRRKVKKKKSVWVRIV